MIHFSAHVSAMTKH